MSEDAFYFAMAEVDVIAAAKCRFAESAKLSNASYAKSRDAIKTLAAGEQRLQARIERLRPRSAPQAARSQSCFSMAALHRPSSAQATHARRPVQICPFTGKQLSDDPNSRTYRQNSSYCSMRITEPASSRPDISMTRLKREDVNVSAGRLRRDVGDYNIFSIPRGTLGSGTAVGFWKEPAEYDAPRAVRVHSTGGILATPGSRSRPGSASSQTRSCAHDVTMRATARKGLYETPTSWTASAPSFVALGGA